MDTIIIATKNQGKLNEFKAMLEPRGFEVSSILELNPELDIEETGASFRENAAIKAETLARQLNQPVIADDSGLMVDALDGRPGIYSARYAGEHKDDRANLEKVLAELKGVPEKDRSAQFICALAVAVPGQETIVFEGVCEGMITEYPIGERGFGYDPIFLLPPHNKTMAELTKAEKNSISHRAIALTKLMEKVDLLF
jgi:XTP/dITP diphosphohydrolase